MSEQQDLSPCPPAPQIQAAGRAPFALLQRYAMRCHAEGPRARTPAPNAPAALQRGFGKLWI